MSEQINQSELFTDLPTEQQQFLVGGAIYEHTPCDQSDGQSSAFGDDGVPPAFPKGDRTRPPVVAYGVPYFGYYNDLNSYSGADSNENSITNYHLELTK